MRKKLISILIANVLFLTNAGFTSLAVEQNIDESIAASSTEVTAEAAVEADEGESQEGDGSDLYFDDVEYVKIQSFTELPEEVKNQQLKQGGRLEELNFPESLEVSVVADLGRDDRIREQLGRERELMREAEREALEAEEKEKASAEDTEEEPEEEIEEEENEEGEGFSQIIDGEEIYFFGSDSEEATQQTSAESASENVDQTEDEPEETSSGEAGIVGASNANASTSASTNASTGASVAESATAENTNAAPEPAVQEQSSSNESIDTSSVETTETPAEEPAETPSDAGNEGSGEESTPSEDLVGRIISIFRPLMVHAAEEVQEPVEEKEEETAEPAVEEEKEDAPENEDTSNTGDSTEENAGNSGDGEDAAKGNPAETPADNEEDVEETENEQVESIEIVSGIEWVLDPSRSDADPFSSEVIGKKFVFVPVLVIPDYYYIEAELPTITVDIVEDYFAFDKAVDVDGVKIRVRADEGVFPEGATLFAQKLQEEDEKKVQDKVEEQLEEATKIAKAYTFDIQIRDKDGNEIEPDTEKGRVFVSFEVEEVSNADYDAEIYHVIEDKNTDGASDNSAADENKSEEVVENSENEAGVEGSVDAGSYENVADDEDADTSGQSDSPAKNNGDSYDERAKIDGYFTIKKLEAEVVDGEEEKAIEAETDSFSTYSLVFTHDDAQKTVTVENNSVICLSKELKSKLNASTNLAISDAYFSNTSDATDHSIKSDNDVYVAYLTDSDSDGIPDINDGLFEAPNPQTGGDWFLVVKRPFTGEGKEKEINVDYTLSGYETGSGTWKVKIQHSSVTSVSVDNDNYPYGAKLGSNSFKLAISIVEDSDNGAIYQWQCKKGSGGNFEDIDYANQKYFESTLTTDGYKSGDWFRCLVNGKETSAVQIITRDGDGTSREWTGSYKGSGTWCYVSNGTMAYTVDKSVNNKLTFDVVGLFGSKMIQTTLGSSGWTVITNENESLTGKTFTSEDCYLDELYFRFTGSNSILIVADLANNQGALAIGANCKVGDVTNAASGTLRIETDSNKKHSIAYMATESVESAQDIVNRGNSGNYPAYSIKPVSETGLTMWVGLKDGFKPYAFNSGSESVTIGGTTYPVTATSEGVPAGTAMSWSGVTTGQVGFTFSIGNVENVSTLETLRKASYDYKNSGVTTSIKKAELVVSDLLAYCSTVGNPSDYVEEKMTIQATSTASSTLKQEAVGSTTTTTTNSSSGTGSSSTSTNARKADYIKIDIAQTKKVHGATSSTTSAVTEVIKDADNANSGELPLQIVLTYDFSEKNDIKVVREHNGSAETFKEGSGSDGTYKLDPKGGKIYIYSNKFSTFGVSYQSDYTVTFDNGTSKSTVKVKPGETVKKPEPDPTRNGYTFKGWYWDPNNPSKGPTAVSNSSTTSKATNTSSLASTSSGSLYNFDNKVYSDILIKAAWALETSTDLEASKAAAMADSDNESRAPKTGDDLPVVWLWVLLLVAGVTTFTVSAREIANAGKNPEQPKKRSKLQVYLLLAGIIIKTTFNFIVRKIRENKAKVLLGLSTAVILVSCIVLASTVLQYHKAENLYSDADVTYVETSEDEEVDEYVEEIKELAGEEPKFDWWDCAQVNLKELKAEYPEVVGWIYFENENISYPIMYSGDNAKYLKTAYTGEKAKAGAIFIDGESTPDFTDPHSLIYGHNMRDLSMFGRLRYYMTTPDYYQDHQYFQIFTEDKVYRYQIFAYEEVADNHDVFWVFGKEPTGYYKMLKEIEQGSYCNSGITTNESDHVITLATCTDKDNERLIVSAVRTDEYDYVQ